ncbi:MAG: SDR family oxidoreductase [Pseudomonadota bacterium]
MSDTPTVIVTGAGSGIGAATAKRFAADGWNVTLNGRRRNKLEEVVADLPKDQVLIVDGDVSETETNDRLVAETVERFGRIDCLVNNAGIARVAPLGDLSREDFEAMMTINVTGIFSLCTAALPELRKSKGSIVNVTSVSGLGGDWFMFGYNTSKGAVSNMTRGLALDLGREGIRVNAVAPSLTKSEMTTTITDSDRMLQMFKNRMPLGRPAEPEEVASVIAFLAGPDASFVNGVVLPVDGGVSASNGQPNFAP